MLVILFLCFVTFTFIVCIFVYYYCDICYNLDHDFDLKTVQQFNERFQTSLKDLVFQKGLRLTLRLLLLQLFYQCFYYYHYHLR